MSAEVFLRRRRWRRNCRHRRYVDPDLAQSSGHCDLDAGSAYRKGRHVGEAHLGPPCPPSMLVAGDHPCRPACRGCQHALLRADGPVRVSSAKVTVPIVPWPHMGRQPVVSMNRMAISQSSRVGGYRIDARHHVVAARLEHQACANPVILGDEMGACARSWWSRASCGPPPATRRTGIAAGVTVDAEETNCDAIRTSHSGGSESFAPKGGVRSIARRGAGCLPDRRTSRRGGGGLR